MYNKVTTNRSKRARKSSIQDEIQNTSHNLDKTQEVIVYIKYFISLT